MIEDKRLCEIIILSKILTKNYQNKINEISKNYGLTNSEAKTLLFFYDNPNCFNAKDFKNNHHVSKSYVSKAIKLLLDKKLIKIIVDNTDKRYQKIEINSNAKKIIKDLIKIRNDFKFNLMKDINEKDLNIFFEVLRKIEKNIMIEKGN